MESAESKEGTKNAESKFKQEIYSRVIRAGKRTYFFDVKSTRKNEFYLTITESKKRFGENGDFQYEKHKIFLYQEDFQKFMESLEDVMDYITDVQRETETGEEVSVEEENGEGFSDVDFDEI